MACGVPHGASPALSTVSSWGPTGVSPHSCVGIRSLIWADLTGSKPWSNSQWLRAALHAVPPAAPPPSEEALVVESQGQLLRPVFLLAVKTDFTSFGRNLLSWVKMAVVASSSKSGKGKFEYCRGHLCLNLLLMRLLPGFIQFHIPFMYFMKHNFSNNCLTKYRCL